MEVWTVVARYWRKLKEFKTQSSYRYIIKPQRQLTRLECNIDKGATISFPSTVTPYLLIQDNHSKTFFFCITLGLIIYTSVARIAIDYVSSF